ncbi:MAG: TetR/AcrR family transcriptional regulator [Marmoricola sp.]
MAEGQARKYDNSRREGSARERVLEAALTVARNVGTRNWADVTFKAVAEEAGVSERTVYRHFPTQRDLHDAVMMRFNKDSAISYEDLTLDDVPGVVERLFTSLATFSPRAMESLPPPAVIAMDRERIHALLRAADGDKSRAAILDVLWSIETYERLVINWRLSTEEAVEVVTSAVRRLLET